MKEDEYNILIEKRDLIDLPTKRKNHIINKWVKKGWLSSDFKKTDEFYRIKFLALNAYKHEESLFNRVVNIYFNENKVGFSQSTGIIIDSYDNGLHFYTTKKCKQGTSWFLGYSFVENNFKENNIAYIEHHPNPHKIWKRLNYLMWEKEKSEDYFHDKYSWMWCGDSNLHGKCTNQCQCKFL